MAKSYNGWFASPDLKTRLIEPVKGCRLRVADNQNVVDVFTYLVQQFHKRVDDVTKPHPADDWGFAFRQNRNANNLSNHSSGTAIDLDATEHPNGVKTSRTFTPAQIAEVHEILRELDGVVRWGGDYTNTVDAMHFEINVAPGKLQEIGKLLRKEALPGQKAQADGPKKSYSTLANEVIAGKWGNGDVRRGRLVKAGYNYEKVQDAVKKKLAAKASKPDLKPLVVIAGEVIANRWGNGDVRVRRLKAAGYNPAKVQAKVNELLSSK
jgi:hypothetical protein